MELDVRTLYVMYAVLYLVLHGIVWFSLSRDRNWLVIQWSASGIVSAAGIGLLALQGILPDTVVAVFGQLLMAVGNFSRQWVLRAVVNKPSVAWIGRIGLFHLAYLLFNGWLFHTGASHTQMMVVFFGFYALICLEFLQAGRDIAVHRQTAGARSVQWGGLVFAVSLGIKTLALIAGWGTQALYESGGDQVALFGAQFLAISLLNFGFMQIFVDQFQQERAQAERNYRVQEERAQQAEQHAQSLSQLLREREDILRQLTLSNKSAGMEALVSSTAHEVNQPLTTIVLKTELIDSYLSGVDVEPQVRDLLQQIRRDTHLAGGMIRTIRNMFNRGSSHFGPLDFGDLLRDTVGMVQSHAKRQGVVLTLDASGALPLMGDATQLQQVLLNMLNNAVQSFAGLSVGQPRVSLKCQKQEHWLQLSVQDNGCGIEPDVRDDVLALFKSPRSRGMGVGLWLSQSVVENHGGTLSFVSTPGQGTVFELRLPLRVQAPVS